MTAKRDENWVPECFKCHVTMSLDQGCEWPENDDLILCASCAVDEVSALHAQLVEAREGEALYKARYFEKAAESQTWAGKAGDLTAQLVEARADVVAAAGDLPVPVPAPGTDMARLLIANRLLKGELADARASLAQVRKQADDALALHTEAEKERDEAQANYRFMVEHAADQKLDGYRELGAKIAAAEQDRDYFKAAYTRKLADEAKALEAAQTLCTERDSLRGALVEIEERTRPDGDMADRAVNEHARAALAGEPKTTSLAAICSYCDAEIAFNYAREWNDEARAEAARIAVEHFSGCAKSPWPDKLVEAYERGKQTALSASPGAGGSLREVEAWEQSAKSSRRLWLRAESAVATVLRYADRLPPVVVEQLREAYDPRASPRAGVGAANFFWVPERSGAGFCWYAPADPDASCGADVASIHLARRFSTKGECEAWIASSVPCGYRAVEHGIIGTPASPGAQGRPSAGDGVSATKGAARG